MVYFIPRFVHTLLRESKKSITMLNVVPLRMSETSLFLYLIPEAISRFPAGDTELDPASSVGAQSVERHLVSELCRVLVEHGVHLRLGGAHGNGALALRGIENTRRVFPDAIDHHLLGLVEHHLRDVLAVDDTRSIPRCASGGRVL